MKQLPDVEEAKQKAETATLLVSHEKRAHCFTQKSTAFGRTKAKVNQSNTSSGYRGEHTGVVFLKLHARRISFNTEKQG